MNNEHEVIKQIRRLAAENPDFVYQRPDPGRACKYVENGEGSCIIGQAILVLYPTLVGTLSEYDDDEFNPAGWSVKHVLESLFPNRFAIEELLWAGVVQGQQDIGTPWSKAVAEADHTCDPRWSGV